MNVSAKVPVSKVNPSKRNLELDLQVPVSPTGSESREDEVAALRARNKLLSEALANVNESAKKAFKKNFDLVWFARNRCTYHLHLGSTDGLRPLSSVPRQE